ncbi:MULTISPECIES: glycosyltransferase family 4 protein [Thiorhodovibrio]|uniref:glycosyltransferase family 4 protein n=1 Tax=Thiorhodovibrio TaxID=61593 RepID=UPI001913F7C3|nr:MULTISPECIES: glycosyltransferase family 1 protein [Thiorhodovibrio]WPL12753.1 D-inositol 3-phosphate glycosyltransferase [Thiorhodovibrio litoralis]
MKIAINTLFFIPGEVGGSETYLLEILREWKRQELPHDFILFTNLENHERLSSEFAGEGWQCVLCPFKARNRVIRILREQFELPGKVRKSGANVLWSPGYTAPFFCGSPQVVSILDMQYKRFPQDLSFVGRFTTEVLVQAASLRAKQLLTISEFSKSEILRFTRAKADKIAVTPLAADPIFAEPFGGEPLIKDPYILCVANTYPHKNVDQLVRAFVALEEQIPHQLVLVGLPRLGEAAVQAALRGLRDPNRFSRLSGLNRSHLVGLYQQADLFAFPSLYEGFGLPVLEAMLAGAPVLSTRCGSIPEVGGDYVKYVESNDDEAWVRALLQALTTDYPHDERKGEAARKWREQFVWTKTAKETFRALIGVVRHLPSSAWR